MTSLARSDGYPRPPDAGGWDDPDVPLVVLDLASVETFLLMGVLSRTISEPGGALWCPFESEPAGLDLDRVEAERRAAGLGLSVVWPGEQWRPVPRAMRVAALAMANGCVEPYIRTMSRMAFAAGMDVDKVSPPVEPKRSHLRDPEPYFVAVDEELGLDAQEVTAAIQEGSESDLQLRGIAAGLAGVGITRAPALRRNGELHLGADAISGALAERDAPHASRYRA